MTTTMSRLPAGAGGSFTGGSTGVTGTGATVATLLGGGGMGAAASALSNRSTTRRLPYWAFGARTKLFGVTAFFRSMTTRKSVGVRWAERMAVIGVLEVLTFNGAPRVAPSNHWPSAVTTNNRVSSPTL